MADKMVIEIAADPKQATSAFNQIKTELGNLEKLAMQMAASFKKIGGIDPNVAQSLSHVNNAAKETSGTFLSMKNAIVSGIKDPMGAAAGGAEKLLTALGPVGVVLSVVATAALAAAKPLVEMTLAAGKAAEQTGNMADRLGISINEMKQLGAMSRIAGVDIGVLEGATRIIATALEDSAGAGAKASKAIAALGVATGDATGGDREYGAVLLDVLDKLGKVEDGNKRAYLSNQVFARGSKELLPMIKNMGDLKAMVSELGIGQASEEGVKGLMKLDDQVDALQEVWNKFKESVATKLEPFVIDIVVGIRKKLTGAGDFFNDPFLEDFYAEMENKKKEKSGLPSKGSALESPNKNEFSQYKSGISVIGAPKRSQTEDDINKVITKLKGDLAEQQKIFDRDATGVGPRLKAADAIKAIQAQLDKNTTTLKAMEKARALRESMPDLRHASGEAAKMAGLENNTTEQRRLGLVYKADFENVKRIDDNRNKKLTDTTVLANENKEYQAKRLTEERAFTQKLGEWQLKSINDQLADYRKRDDAILVMEGETQQHISDIIRDNEVRTAEFQIGHQQKSAEERKNQELAYLETINAKTVPQKAALEQAKLAIEKRYIDESLRLELEKLDLIRKRSIEILELRKVGASDADRAVIQTAIDSTNSTANTEIDTARKTAEDKKQTETVKATANTAKIVREQWQKTYDDIKHASEGVFDAMLSKSTSIWQAMADSFKNIFLTALKALVTSTIAKAFTNLINGRNQDGSTGSGGSGGGSGSGGSSSGGGILASLRNVFSGSGRGGRIKTSMRTPPFLPEGSGGGWNGGGGGGGWTGGGGGWTGGGGGWNGGGGGWNGGGSGPDGRPTILQRNSSQNSAPNAFQRFMSTQNSQGKETGAIGTDSAKGIFGTDGKMGQYGPAVQGGLIAGGTALAMDGWNRGGGKGMLEMAGGGAAIGFAVGGPMGAAIGAAAGAEIGTLKWIFGTDQNKEMKERVQSITGVRIDSKDTLKTLIAGRKASGLSLDAYIKSRPAAEIISLYAQSTGQKYKNPYDLGQFSMQLNNGSVYEQASYKNGASNDPFSSLPGIGFTNLDNLSGNTSTGGGQNISLTLSPEQTQTFLEGKATDSIRSNPRLVADANNQSMSQNYNRFNIASANQPTAIAA